MRVWFAALVLANAVGCEGPGAPEVCAPGSPSALTAPGRYLLGDAVPYPRDPSIAGRADVLHASRGQRRALGWERAGAVLAPVEIAGLSASHEVPLFQTWYDAEDLRRIIRHLSDGRADPSTPSTPAEIEAAFAWNTSSVLEQEAWPEGRLADFVATRSTTEQVRGAGGIPRVSYDPLAARHLLESETDIARCVTEGAPAWDEVEPGARVTTTTERVEIAECGSRVLGPYRVAPGGSFRADLDGDAALAIEGAADARCDDLGCEVDGPAHVELRVTPRTASLNVVDVSYDAHLAPFVPCLDDGFPIGSAIVKADYRRVGFGVLLPAYDTSAESLRAIRAGDAGWGEGAAEVDPGPDEIFTVELPNGNRFRLAALHLMTKELDHWAWVTLWWSDSADTDFGADRPAELGGSPWDDYKMCAVTWFDERDPDPTAGALDPTLADALAAVHEGAGGPSWCSNPYLEEGPGNAASNCIGCHQHAGTALSPEEILLRNDFGRNLERLNFPFDYTFAPRDVLGLFP